MLSSSHRFPKVEKWLNGARGCPAVAGTFGFYSCRILAADRAPLHPRKCAEHQQETERKEHP